LNDCAGEQGSCRRWDDVWIRREAGVDHCWAAPWQWAERGADAATEIKKEQLKNCLGNAVKDMLMVAGWHVAVIPLWPMSDYCKGELIAVSIMNADLNESARAIQSTIHPPSAIGWSVHAPSAALRDATFDLMLF
jgi:hypothetical protein